MILDGINFKIVFLLIDFGTEIKPQTMEKTKKILSSEVWKWFNARVLEAIISSFTIFQNH